MPLKSDLLDADASVYWAVSNLPMFEERLNAWVKENFCLDVKKNLENFEHDGLIAVQKEPIPLIFNAEAGAYINAIRSSLDILATSIGARDGFTRHDKIYFPIANSPEHFYRRQFAGKEFFESISKKHQATIERLQPYYRGNTALFTLNKLDIMRKHRRLLTTQAGPTSLTYTGGDRELIFFGDIPETRTRRISGSEILLAYLGPGSKLPQMSFVANVVFDEGDVLKGLGVVSMLRRFADIANEVIGAFDF